MTARRSIAAQPGRPITTLSDLERLGAQSFDAGDDDVWDVFDPEGNSLRIHPLP